MEKHLQANIIIANNNGLCLTFDRTAKSLREVKWIISTGA